MRCEQNYKIIFFLLQPSHDDWNKSHKNKKEKGLKKYVKWFLISDKDSSIRFWYATVEFT